MSDNIGSIRQMSEGLTDAAGYGKFREKLHAELTELTSAFDDVAERSRLHTDNLLSTQQRVETLMSDIRQLDFGIDELMTRLACVEAVDANSVTQLHAQFKVSCLE